MSVRLTEVERAYFVRKAGGAEPTVPFNQVKRAYIAGFIGGLDPSIKIDQAEIQWLQKIAIDDGEIPAKYIGENLVLPPLQVHQFSPAQTAGITPSDFPIRITAITKRTPRTIHLKVRSRRYLKTIIPTSVAPIAIGLYSSDMTHNSRVITPVITNKTSL